jgi:hypothetical protein
LIYNFVIQCLSGLVVVLWRLVTLCCCDWSARWICTGCTRNTRQLLKWNSVLRQSVIILWILVDTWHAHENSC